MSEALVERLAPRLRSLGKGGYIKEYVRKGRMQHSSLRSALSELFEALGVGAKEDVEVPGTGVVADFRVGRNFLFVDRELTPLEAKKVGRLKGRCVQVWSSVLRSDGADSGLRVIRLGGRGKLLQTIFLDDPSFNFDYSHILPHTQKCSVMHGHTSSALVEIVGEPVDGMVVDFGIAKEIIRGALGELDHKLIINAKYVVREDGGSVTLRFHTVHGDFAIQAPKGTTVLLDGEATVENLAKEVLSRIAPRLPPNVTAVGVYVYEGMNKGSHLLAQLHQGRRERARRRR